MEAARLSKDLKTYLEQSQQQVMTVHSVFQSAINLIDQQGSLATLLCDTKTLVPMSAILSISQREISAIHPEDKVLIVNNGLLFQRNNLFLSTENAELWDQSIGLHGKVNSLKAQRESLSLIRKVIVEEDASIGIGGLVALFDFEDLEHWLSAKTGFFNPYCDFILEPMAEVLTALMNDDQERLLETLPRFIGFGPGLTPSTDDFLAGVMISLYYDAAVKNQDLDATKNILWSMYQMTLGRTTAISENMLKLAALGYVSEDYKSLANRLFFKSEESVEKLAQAAVKHGASSGIDFLFGFYCMNSIRVTKSLKETLADD